MSTLKDFDRLDREWKRLRKRLDEPYSFDKQERILRACEKVDQKMVDIRNSASPKLRAALKRRGWCI